MTVTVLSFNRPRQQEVPKQKFAAVNHAHHISLPKNYHPEKPYYLALFLHSLGRNEKTFRPHFAKLNNKNFIIASLRGNRSHGKGYKWAYSKSARYIGEMRTYLRQSYLTKGPSLLVGYSNGAFQVVHMALERPYISSHFAAISGGSASQLKKPALPGLRLLLLSGSQGVERAVAKQMKQVDFHLRKQGSLVEHHVFHGQGHWLTVSRLRFALDWFLSQNL